MSKTSNSGSRLPWEKPELLVIKPGSAETKDNSGFDDGGKGSTDKS